MWMHAFLLLITAQVDLSFSAPPDIIVDAGDVIAFDVIANADSPQGIAAIDIVLSWDPARLELVVAAPGPLPWFVAGFLDDPDGINDDITDGEAIYTVLAPPSTPPSVPPQLPVVRLHYRVLATGEVTMLPTLGSFASTKVVGTEPGLLITGDLPAPQCLGVEGTWTDLGNGKPGTGGLTPVLTGTGGLACEDLTTYTLTNALGSTLAYFVLGLGTLNLPFKGGILVPTVDIIIPVITSPSGVVIFGFPWPLGVPPGVSLYYQYWIIDAFGFAGFSASNGLQSTTS